MAISMSGRRIKPRRTRGRLSRLQEIERYSLVVHLRQAVRKRMVMRSRSFVEHASNVAAGDVLKIGAAPTLDLIDVVGQGVSLMTALTLTSFRCGCRGLRSTSRRCADVRRARAGGRRNDLSIVKMSLERVRRRSSVLCVMLDALFRDRYRARRFRIQARTSSESRGSDDTPGGHGGSRDPIRRAIC